MEKKNFYTEAAYFAGLFLLAIGTAFLERVDWGMSMVVAPSYLVYLKVSEVWRFYTFGMSEYVLQAALLCVLFVVIRRIKAVFFFSFVSAFLFGNILDGCIALVGLIPRDGAWSTLAARAGFFIAGAYLCSLGVSLLFRSYFPPEVYELFVKEVARKFGRPIDKVKMVYDIVSCLVGVALSFIFFGFGVFVGVKWGTIVLAAVNGPLIGFISRGLDARFSFKDALPWRARFSG